MRRTTVFPSLTSPAVRRLAMASHCMVRPPHFTRALPLPPAYGLRILALVGLLVGILLLALPPVTIARPAPNLPGQVARAATRSPEIFTFGSEPSLILTCAGDRLASLLPYRMSPPRDSFALEDDLDDDTDDPAALMVLTAGTRGHPLASARQGITDVTSIHLWPSCFLLRPQLLTR
jgi:hypothetical protein